MMRIMSNPSMWPADGRLQRAERSREAIVGALLELVGEGELEPTALQVAERARVGVRSVFRHFSDMETLFAAMNARLAEDVGACFVETEQRGRLEDRIDGLVTRRTTLFERFAPYLRSAARLRARSEFLQAEHARGTRALRRDLHCWLPELARWPPETAEALELLLSFEAFDRLRETQRLGPKRAATVLRASVIALTAPLDAPD